MPTTTDPSDPRLDVRKPDGQNEAYLVLSAEERAKGHVMPVYRVYRHAKCGTDTTMGLALCETYARDPGFYGATFCSHCGAHFPLRAADGPQFFWVEQSGAAYVPVGAGPAEARKIVADELDKLAARNLGAGI